MNEEVLITLVEGYEELYNLKHRSYHNQQRRDSIWEEIGEILGNESGKACRDRWTKIRDNHRKALQLRKTKSGQAAVKMRPPKYNKELKFLLPYLHDDENRSTNIPNIDNVTNPEQSSLNSPSSSVTSPIPSPHYGGTKSNTKTARSRNSDKMSTASVLKEYLEHSESIRNTQVNSISYSDEHDPLIGFFINMARTVKSFPIQEQIKIKNEIFSIVNNTELRLAMQSSIPETIRSTLPYPMADYITDMRMRQEASTSTQNACMISQPQSMVSNVPTSSYETTYETVQNTALLSQPRVIQDTANTTSSVNHMRPNQVDKTTKLLSQTQVLKSNVGNTSSAHQTIQAVENNTTFLSQTQVKLEQCEYDLSPNSTSS